jgi:hypothetical protein
MLETNELSRNERRNGFFDQRGVSSPFPTTAKGPLLCKVWCGEAGTAIAFTNARGFNQTLEIPNQPKPTMKMIAATKKSLTSNPLPSPPPPFPTSLTSPLSTTDKFLVSSDDNPDFMISWARTNTSGYYHLLYSGIPYWVTNPPPGFILAHRTYWTVFHDEVVPPNGELNLLTTISHGVSDTQTESFSAEIGIGPDELSAKLSLSLGYSITIEDSVSTAYAFSWKNDSSSSKRYTKWQLNDEFVIETNDACTDPRNTPWPKGTIASDILSFYPDGKSAFVSGIGGSDHAGYVTALSTTRLVQPSQLTVGVVWPGN